MSSIRTNLTIAAPPERVWAVLTDFAAYPQWNTIISRVRADVHEGAAIRFRMKIEGTPELGFTARIIRCAPGRELAWRGGAPLLPSVAWGEHYFRLAPAGEGTELAHGEDFGGLLGFAVRGPVHRQITRTYDAFNRALKTRAETSATST